MTGLSSQVSMLILLLFLLQVVGVVLGNFGDQLVRKKRDWILPPKPLSENKDYTKEKFVAKIRSDFQSKVPITYSLEGPGASQAPYHVFHVDHKTGWITVTRILDREEIDTYHLFGIAKTSGEVEVEKKIGIRIKVVDENDNEPVFGVIKPAEVMELSSPGTPVMKLNATDRDEPETDNSKIAYSILSQSPPDDLFYITRDGTVCIKQATLDRERQDKYILTVIGKDLDGKPGGHTGTGTVTINVLDVNDNLPTLEKEAYEGSIEENTQGVEVMRIKAHDLDLKDTDNWEAVFEIVKGNEAGYFSFKTDPKTNEGILILDKAVDYEDVKNLDLGIAVRNKAPQYAETQITMQGETHSSTETKSKIYPLKINVKNRPEGPAFDPKVKAIPISEGGQTIKINDVIAHYPAIDGDTRKPAVNVRYVKGSDPDNWLTIDLKTAEIKLNKMPDRESPYLKNGTYIAKVLCISEDEPGKTATGTVAIQVEDFNDNCPTLTSNIQTMCTTADSVIANAKDEDLFPNGAPFSFRIIEDRTEGKWQVEHLNDTAAILRAQEPMWPGIYKVTFEVKDAQGETCPDPQKVDVRVCTCTGGVKCERKGLNKGAALGPAGIGLLFLGLLLLLLIPLLLLICHCEGATSGFTEMPFDTKSHLINYRTEGQGENTELPLINVPGQVDGGVTIANKPSTMAPAENTGLHPSVATMDLMNGAVSEDRYYRERACGVMNEGRGSGFYSEMQGRESVVGGEVYDCMALPSYLLAQYYGQKLANGNENLAVKDRLLVYDHEGQGSCVGSVGCCSLLESDNDLQFLDDLGPKFKILAEICGGKKIQTEVKQVVMPPPSSSINTHTSLTGSMTTQKLPSPPQPQMTIPKTVCTMVKKTVKESTVKEGVTTVKEGMANQSQMLLLQQQQPVYYTTNPVLQPMHYVVHPQVQNTVLLAEAPATNLQGMVLVDGSQTVPAQGMVIQGQTAMSTAQGQGPGVILVGGGGVQGNANLVPTSIPLGSQTLMVVEGNIPAGSAKVVKGSQTNPVQGGTWQSGGLSGPQRIIKSSTSDDSKRSSTTTTLNTTPSYRKVVGQETREIC
ncbi:desmoglein-2-like [Xyrichtys novacula]|uniref:Desmoglein-2-like n=1 Tax=Xyrichtys novacula TaxID=13765 RepID=A0AAV1FGH2_XYRNO|nr:desmoglein-2-like [Xyrichtys novacula]